MKIPSPLPPEPDRLPDFTAQQSKTPAINWYRSAIPREAFKQLHQKSDLLGALQTLGYLAVYAGTAALAILSFYIWSPWVTIPLVFLHGMVAAFLINAVHELGHGTVFKTRAFNRGFCRLFAFLGWINHELFQESHIRHHRYTLHPPDDLEVVLPIRLMIRHFLLTGFLNLGDLYPTLKTHLRKAMGKFEGEWEQTLFPESDPESRKAPVNWARIVLIGHGLIISCSLLTGNWIVAVVISGARWYGGWLFFLCNNTQHIGLRDFVPDLRLCCRTFTLNPVIQFLYWHMNFHTEHHMYAAVPCYHLPRLHRLILDDLPPTQHGLIAVWKEIGTIQHRQDMDPDYVHPIQLPGQAPANPASQG